LSDQDAAGVGRSRLPVLPFDRLLLDWRGARDRTEAYARPSGWTRTKARAVSAVEGIRGGPPGAAGRARHAPSEILVEEAPGRRIGRQRLEAWRLAARWAGARPRGARARAPRRSRPRAVTRGTMPRRLAAARGGAPGARGAGRPGRAWLPARFLEFLVLIPTVIASGFMLQVLPYQGRTALEVLIALLFGALFGWISIGFWTAFAGFALLLRGGDRYVITRTDAAGAGPIDPGSRTAIVMPICEEDVERVYTGLDVIQSELERHGELSQFDFFVLSDTIDPSTIVREELAWAEWRRRAERVFYRRRKVRRKRKSGNVADFCRRFGAGYRYMIVLDADSLMSAETIVRLVRLMERNPDVGVIQTAPVVFRARSLFARAQQFASRLYGSMFWQACTSGTREPTGATTRSCASSPSCGTAACRACPAIRPSAATS
jgi:hypothetical protein